MSLDWNIEKVQNNEEIKTKEEWPVTEALIFQTMPTGIPWLKDEATAREFFRRVAIGEKLRGPLLNRVVAGPNGDELKPRWITLKDCTRRIGLYTNASSITAAKFWRQIVPKWAEEYANKKASE